MASTSPAQHPDNLLKPILTREEPRFADRLTKGQQAAARIIAALRRKTGLTIDRYILSGSTIGYRTAAPQVEATPDFYLYPFFNPKWENTTTARIQRLIPKILDRIVQEFGFRNWSASKINEFTVRTRFTALGTHLCFDIVPAINFFKGEAKTAQWHQVLQRCANANTNLRDLNASASEKLTEFLDKQGPFCRNVVRLAKIWNEKCVHSFYMPGRSLIVELVAVKAAQEETEAEGETGSTLTGALVRFFKYMQTHWSNLKIVFDQVEDLPECARDKYLSRKQETGILIDPVNPYVNFLEDETVRSGWEGFQLAAGSSLDNWERFQGGHGNAYVGPMIGML